MSKFHALHWNFTAKRLRHHYPAGNTIMDNPARRVVEDIALEFAQKFAEDNVSFDPVHFLSKCSEDESLGELWWQHLDDIGKS